MQKGKCPKCGSQELVPDVAVLDRGHYNQLLNLTALVEEKPEAWLFKGQVATSLKAWVCGDCGFTELYAKEPEALLAAHRKQIEAK